MIEHLSVGDVLALHDHLMVRMGDAPAPVRDEGALESAIMRPRMAAHYEGADLVRQGVLLAVGISQAQAFLDGNKRTAYLALDTFLWINGTVFAGEPLELARHLEIVAERSAGGDREGATDDFEGWLRGGVASRSAGP
jgi:death-on-curing protein